MNNEKVLKVFEGILVGGVWGTIGPYSLSSAKLYAERAGAGYGVLTHSAYAAMEVQLRACGIGYGDEVVVASYSSPINSMAVAAVGATPVFVDIESETGTLCPRAALKAVTDKTKALIADNLAGNPCKAKELREMCDAAGIKFILNAGDVFGAEVGGRPEVAYAYGAVADLSDGIVTVGEGGIVMSENFPEYSGNFAIHNCGREIGDAATLAFDKILGGDMRITEWQAALIPLAMEDLDRKMEERRERYAEILSEFTGPGMLPLQTVTGGKASGRAVVFRFDPKAAGKTAAEYIGELSARGIRAENPYAAMHRQPFFSSPEFVRMTGSEKRYNDADFVNSTSAEEGYIWIYA